jgi:O-antigen ligase
MHNLPRASGQSAECTHFDGRLLSGAGALAQSPRGLPWTVSLPGHRNAKSVTELFRGKPLQLELQRLFFCPALIIRSKPRCHRDLVKEAGLMGRAIEVVAVVLLAAALILIQVLIGGTRLIFSFPSYAILALVALLTLFLFRQPRPRPAQICLITSAIFFGYILVRGFFSPVVYTARQDIYSVVGGLIVYWFVALFCTSAKQRAWIVISLFGLALVHVLIGAIQFRDGNNFMLIPFLQRVDYGRRASGFYVCPNHLAGALEVLGVFGLSLVCWSRFPTWSKLLIGYVSAVCYAGVLLSASRGGYASSVTSLFVLAVLSLIVLRRAGTRLVWSIGGVGALAALIIGGSAFLVMKKSDFLADRANNALNTAPVRLDMWHAAVEEWKSAPVVGTGSGTYLYYGRKFRTERVQQDPVNAHNDYLHLLAEYGIIGGLLFLLFLGTHLHNGWKNFQRLGPKRVVISNNLLSTSLALNLGALAAVAAYIVHSFVDFNLHIPANVLLLAFVFGVLANAGIQRETEDSAVPMPILWWRAVLPALGAFLAIQCVRLLPGEYFAEHARSTLRDNQPDVAIRFALRGLETEKHNPFLYQYLASAKLTRCDTLPGAGERASCYEDALSALTKARELAPSDRSFLVPLAATYDALDRFPEAEWIFYEARQWDPKSIYLNEIYKYHLSRWQTSQSTMAEQSPAQKQ